MNSDSKNFSSEKKAPLAHRESHVAGRLGISRDTVRQLRHTHLSEGVDWVKERGVIMLTEPAVLKLQAALRMPPPPDDGPAENNGERQPQATARPFKEPRALIGPAGNASGIVTLKAWRATTNKHILEAYWPGKNPGDRGAIVRVRVKDSSNFVRHMELPATPLGPADFWELARPCPRDRGRW